MPVDVNYSFKLWWGRNIKTIILVKPISQQPYISNFQGKGRDICLIMTILLRLSSADDGDWSIRLINQTFDSQQEIKTVFLCCKFWVMMEAKQLNSSPSSGEMRGINSSGRAHAVLRVNLSWRYFRFSHVNRWKSMPPVPLIILDRSTVPQVPCCSAFDNMLEPQWIPKICRPAAQNKPGLDFSH